MIIEDTIIVRNISLIGAYKTHFNVREIVVSRFPKSTVNAYACFI